MTDEARDLDQLYQAQCDAADHAAQAQAEAIADECVVSVGSLDDPGVGTWDPSEDCPDGDTYVPEEDPRFQDEAGEDELRAAHGA